MKEKYIYQTAIYDTGSESWRIYDINSGHICMSGFDTERECLKTIPDGRNVGDKIIKRITYAEIYQILFKYM